MAKTTSQIVAQNKIERAEAAAIAAARDQIHQQQMEQLVKQRSANANNEARRADHIAQMAANAIAKTAAQNVTTPVQKSSAELRQEANAARSEYEAEKKRAEEQRIAEAKKNATGSAYGAASQQEASRRALEQAAGTVFANYGAKAGRAESGVQSDERGLKAKADYLENEANLKQDTEQLAETMQKVQNLSEEEQRMLDQYAVEQLLPKRDNPWAFLTKAPNALVDKYGEEEVKRMAEAKYRSATQNVTQNVVQGTQERIQNGSVPGVIGENIASIGSNLVGAIAAPVSYLAESRLHTGQFRTLNPNAAGALPGAYTGAVRQETSAKIEGDGSNMWRNLAAVGYQGGMSILDNLARIAASGGSASVSAAIAASGSFGNGLQKYSAQGADPGQAALMAFADAGLEYMTEKLSDAEVLKFFKGGSKPEMIKKFLWQTFGVEPLSEEVNLFAGIAAEAAILGDKAAMNQQIGEMVANGMSYEEASREAWRQVWEEAKQTYAISAISGAGQSAAMNLAGNIARDMKAKVDARNGVQPQQTAVQPEAEVTAEAPQGPQTQPVSKEQMIANALGEATGQKPAQIDKPVRTQLVSSASNNIVENRPATTNTDNNQNDNIQIARPETLWNKRDGKDGWSENADHNSVWATALAMREVNPDYFDQYMQDAEGEHTSAVIDAVINAANDVRQDTISPMAAATVINEVYSKYGESGLKQMYNPRNGNLYDSVLQRMKTVDSQHRPVDIDLDENGRNTALTGRTVTVVEDSRSAQAPEEIAKIQQEPAKAKGKVEGAIRKLADKLGITSKKHSAPSVEVEFTFSKNKGLKESMNKQLKYGGSYTEFAKAIANIDEILANSVMIEKHSDKYKGTIREDPNLESTSVLMGAFRDGNTIIPVQFEIKKSSNNGGQLYVTVAMTKIEADVMGRADSDALKPFLVSASDYNIANIIKNINPEDSHFLKYIPDSMLSEEQRIAKTDALDQDYARISKYERTDGKGPEEVERILSKYGYKRKRTSAVDTSTQSTAQGQIQGTGAAERGFTPKQALINEYGNIPEGENPVRPDQMPLSTNGNDRVSYTARTAVEARVTPDEFVPLIENETVRGGFSYIPIRNDQTVQTATQNIAREGWQTARANWTAQIRAGVSSPEITATGALLYNHAVNAGDHQEAMDILTDYQMAVRNTAQALQAARILKTLTPSDRLYMIRRSVQQMVEDMHLRRPVTIDENLAQQYQNAGTQEEADEILEQIAQDVARQIPPNAAEAFTALRYLNMLGNFKTQIRNVAGNIGSKLVYGFKDKVGAAIETIVDAVTPGGIERTKSFTTDRNTRQAAAADYEAVQDWIMSNGRYDDNRESGEFARMVQENRRMLPPGLEQARRLTNWAMETGDAIFARDAYARALAGYLNARGIRTDDLSTVDSDVLDRGREYAVRQAQEQTFRDNNQVSDFVSGIMRGRDTPTWARMIGEGIMPFRRTPANVLVRAEEYSPLGLINSTVNTIRAARGEISGADLVDSWAKTLTGTALTAIGYGLANMGVLSGGPDEDKEKDEFDQLNGKQDYSLKFTVDGKTYSYTIDWATPAAMPLFLGAQLQKVFSKEGLTWADAEKAFTSIADPMIQMSMLQGVNDTLENIRYVENNMGQFLINATMSYLTQGLTNTLLGQIERSTEETRQTTYVDKDSNVPEWLQRQLGKASQKIPGWDYQQTDYLNAWGEAEENEGGLLYNMLSPGYLSEEQKSAVSDELYRLREATGENVFPQPAKKTVTYTGNDGTLHKDYNLTAEQFEKLQKAEGQEAAKLIADLVENADFAKLTDNQKVGVIRDVYAYAAEQGKKAALEDYHSNADEWIQDMGSDKVGALIRRSAVNTLNSAISKTMNNMQNGWKTTPAAEAEREELYDSYKAMSAAERRNIREDADSNTANYLEARDAGVDHDEFVRVAQSLYNIKPERGQKNARTVQKAEAISRTAGISEREKELFIKQQVSDAQDKNIDDLKKLWRETDELKGAMTMSTYAKLYRDYEDYTKGDGKKNRTVEKWAKEYGISKNTAKELYDIFAK